MSTPIIWLVGDPHGDYRAPTRLALQRRPDAVIFLGDLELPAPLEEVMYPLIKAGITVRGIHGNHDTDNADLWRRLSDGALGPTFNLDGRVETIAGVRVAGLGGIFRGKVWYPPEPPLFASYEAFVDRWSYGRPADHVQRERVVHRATIFPDVYERLAALHADVLVTHEAPGGDGMHGYGFEAVHELAQMLGVRKAFHGHHHEAIRYAARDSVEWIGVDAHQIVDLDGDEIWP